MGTQRRFHSTPNKGHRSAAPPESGIGVQVRRRNSGGVCLLRKSLPQVKLVNCEATRVKLVRRTLSAFTTSPSSCMIQSVRTSCASFLANCPPKPGTISPALTSKGNSPRAARNFATRSFREGDDCVSGIVQGALGLSLAARSIITSRRQTSSGEERWSQRGDRTERREGLTQEFVLPAHSRFQVNPNHCCHRYCEAVGVTPARESTTAPPKLLWVLRVASRSYP